MARKKTKDDRAKKANGDGPVQEPPEASPQLAESPLSGPAGKGPAADAQLTVLTQYIKDLSFENPGAPQTLQGPGQNPQLQVSVNVNAGARAEDVYEVTLHIEVHAKSDSGVIYNVELVYGSLFRLLNIPQNLLQPVLFVDCPTIIFPFMRRVLADVTRDGGFPPLMLDPIDFRGLYAQNVGHAKEGPQGQAN